MSGADKIVTPIAVGKRFVFYARTRTHKLGSMDHSWSCPLFTDIELRSPNARLRPIAAMLLSSISS
jgi:hypothetical protein